jgi:uncharacterized protein YecT (DUF1311 family)
LYDVRVAMFRLFGILFAVASGISLAGNEQNTAGPSFNCDRATSKVEKEICFGASAEVRLMDLYMTDLYRHVLERSNDPDSVRERQRKWLYYRDNYYDREDIGDELGLECSYRRLHDCYSRQIEQLWSELPTGTFEEVASAMYYKYRDILGLNKIPNSKVEAFLYERQARNAVLQIGEWCNSYEERVVLYAEPVLVTEQHGSNTCGGTSHAYRNLRIYCESDSTFVEKWIRELDPWDSSAATAPQKHEIISLCN